MRNAKTNRADAKVFMLDPKGAVSAVLAEAAASSQGVQFRSPAELMSMTAEWPSSRLVAIWNAIPGVVPVRKFTDRSTAIKRIWNAVQSLEPVPANPKDTEKRHGDGARQGTKKSVLLALLARTEGVSVAEIMDALGWQAHSVRGCLSVLSKRGLEIHSFRRPDGARAYSTAPSAASGVEVEG
jgi:Protein of unknown function (DUF3489)